MEILHQINTNPFVLPTIGIFMGYLLAHSKKFFQSLFEQFKRKFIFTAVLYENDQLYADFECWFCHNYYDKYKNVEVSSQERLNQLASPNGGVKKGKNSVYYRQNQGWFIIKYKGRRILILKLKTKMDHLSDARLLHFSEFFFYAYKGSEVIKEMLKEAAAFANQRLKNNQIRVYTNNVYGEWYFTSILKSKSIDNVILPKGQLQALKEDMESFKNGREFYDKHQIFYKRGYCFDGEPGNGKTTLALAMASYFGKDVYVLDINSIDNNGDLKNAFRNLPDEVFLLIEDIDGFFIGRNTVKKDSKLSFSTFLNCLDGSLFKDGLVTIITTNKKSSLDAALLRSGRMDYHLQINNPGREEVAAFVNSFYNVNITLPGYENDWPMCDVQETCYKNGVVDAIAELSEQKVEQIKVEQ